MSIDSLIATGLLPDWLIRQGIPRLLRGRLIAIDCEAANEQHYEVPTAFYQLCLGARLK